MDTSTIAKKAGLFEDSTSKKRYECMLYNGQNGNAIFEWSDRSVVESPVIEKTEDNPTGAYMQIIWNKVVGKGIVNVGDFVAKNENGGFFTIKPNDFYDSLVEVKSVKDRVEQEKTELDEKLHKLEKFLSSETFESLVKEQQHLLLMQLNAMETYSRILGLRLFYLN